MIAARQIFLGRGGTNHPQELSWVRASSYANYVETNFVFKPLEMDIVLEYGLKSQDLQGYNYSALLSVSSTNISASSIGGGGKAFSVLPKDHYGLINVTGQASSGGDIYAQNWDKTHFDFTSDEPVVFNSVRISYATPWSPSILINGYGSAPNSYGGTGRGLSSSFTNSGVVFFAHRNGNGSVVTMSPNSDWVIPQYFLRSCEFIDRASFVRLAKFNAAMDGQTTGLYEIVSRSFFPSTNGSLLFGT